MLVIVVHNSYQQPGGEDEVVEQEIALLRSAGHEVIEYRRTNNEINEFGLMRKVTLPMRVLWARDSKQDLEKLILKARPDVVHFHNTFMLISPSAYYACSEAAVPVVQTLHNYRLLCPAATFLRDGKVCEDCLGRTPPWPGVLHACYRESRLQTATTGAMLTLHRWLKTWHDKVDIYIALTEFARRKFIEGGLPEEKVVVKPNFINLDPGIREGNGDYAIFVGRLSPEKGVRTLLEAWKHLERIPLKIVGDGPLMGKVQAFVRTEKLECVEVLGRCDRDKVFALIKGAQFLVFPSEWYETFGNVAIEAFACGVPVIASRLGAMAEIVKDRTTGLHFKAGDVEDLANKVEWLRSHPTETERMGREARAEYVSKFAVERNYQMLIKIYETAMNRAKGRFS